MNDTLTRRMGRPLTILALALLASCSGGDGQQDDANDSQSVQAAAPPLAEQVDFTAADVGQLVAGEAAPSTDGDTWPQFRGAQRDNIAHQAANLARQWPDGRPRELWRIEGLGMGYSGPAVFGGRAYVHDYDLDAKRWALRCVSLTDGKDIWRWSYEREIIPNHGVTRTVPATDGQYVFSLDPKCVLHAFDAATGKRLWAVDLVATYRAFNPQWYNGQCPLIADEAVVVGVGGVSVLMAAFDKATGKPLWETPNPPARRHGMRHASLAEMTVDGVRQYVWCTTRGLVGVEAATGKLLWEHDWRTQVAVAPSPLPIGDGRVLMTSGYKAGSVMVRVARDGESWKTQDLWTLTWEQFESDCHTPVLWKDHLYAVDMQGRLACLSLDGRVLWRYPDEHKGPFGLGPYLIADGLLYLLEEDGLLHLVEPDPAAYKELAKAQILTGHEAWAPMAVFNGKLLARDLSTLVCLDIAGP